MYWKFKRGGKTDHLYEVESITENWDTKTQTKEIPAFNLNIIIHISFIMVIT